MFNIKPSRWENWSCCLSQSQYTRNNRTRKSVWGRWAVKRERVEDRPNKSSCIQRGAKHVWASIEPEIYHGRAFGVGKWKQRNKNENREVIRDGEIIGEDKGGSEWERKIEQKT